MTHLTLPSDTVGKTGCERVSSQNLITLVLYPRERHSSLPRAVDHWFQAVNMPFNMIVIEGNSPLAVRSELEHREERHQNVEIIYTSFHPTLGMAYNLALPHIRTPYALFVDADVRSRHGELAEIRDKAVEAGTDLMFFGLQEKVEDYFDVDGTQDLRRKLERYVGRRAFLLSHAALNRIGEMSEAADPVLMPLDLAMTAYSKMLPVELDPERLIRADEETAFKPVDYVFYNKLWSADSARRSAADVREKWGLVIDEELYAGYFRMKNALIRTHASDRLSKHANAWNLLNIFSPPVSKA